MAPRLGYEPRGMQGGKDGKHDPRDPRGAGSITYRDAGVDIDAGDELVERIKPLAKMTRIAEVISDVGGFAGLCRVPEGSRRARARQRHRRRRHQAQGRLRDGRARHDRASTSSACASTTSSRAARARSSSSTTSRRESSTSPSARRSSRASPTPARSRAARCSAARPRSCPGCTRDGEYDLAGFAVGVVARKKIVDGTRVAAGDVALALAVERPALERLLARAQRLLEAMELELDARRRSSAARRWARRCSRRRAFTRAPCRRWSRRAHRRARDEPHHGRRTPRQPAARAARGARRRDRARVDAPGDLRPHRRGAARSRTRRCGARSTSASASSSSWPQADEARAMTRSGAPASSRSRSGTSSPSRGYAVRRARGAGGDRARRPRLGRGDEPAGHPRRHRGRDARRAGAPSSSRTWRRRRRWRARRRPASRRWSSRIAAYADRASFDAELVRVLRAHGAEYVVLAGFMRLVTPTLLDAFPMRVVNVHPALLPAFPGVDAQAQALEYGVRVSGAPCTSSTRAPTRGRSWRRRSCRCSRGTTTRASARASS